MTFHDGAGRPWQCNLPVSSDGAIQPNYSFPVPSDQNQKVKAKGLAGKGWVPKDKIINQG
jgi:hypothetical protein